MTSTGTESASAAITEALWDRYRGSGDLLARSQLLDRYLGLVHHVARELAGRTPAAEVDDLVSAGSLGLVRALEGFDRSRGLAFSTYAVRRIRGAMLDDLRSKDWVPRSVRLKNRKMTAAVNAVQRRLGRAPEPAEVAGELGIDLESYWQWRAAVDGGVVMSFEVASTERAERGVRLEETLADPDADQPDTALTRDEQVMELRDAIGTLPEKERTVLSLYYYEELNLRQIAEVLHVTESRISQIRSQAIRRLRERMASEEETE